MKKLFVQKNCGEVRVDEGNAEMMIQVILLMRVRAIFVIRGENCE